MEQLLQTVNLQRHYHMGNSVVRALDGVSLEMAEGSSGMPRPSR